MKTIYRKKQNGFTLIELLVVIAIIGILASVVLVSLSSARQKARDVKRLADIKQIANGLDLYYSDCKEYPYSSGIILNSSVGLAAGIISPDSCSQWTTGILNPPNMTGTVYVIRFPAAPVPADSAACTNKNDYRYTSENRVNYSVTFCLGEKTGGYTAGVHTLTEKGLE